jgi:hypothetical protein
LPKKGSRLKSRFKSRLSSKGGILGIKSISDVAMVIYSAMGISLLGDKIVNVVNIGGTSMAKPLISILMAYFLTPKPLRNVITIIVGLASFGFGLGSLGNLGIANKGFGVYGQRQGTDTANVIGRLP